MTVKVNDKECGQMYGRRWVDVTYCGLTDQPCLLESGYNCEIQEEEEREYQGRAR